MTCHAKCTCEKCNQLREIIMRHPAMYFERLEDEISYQREEISKLKNKIEELSRRYYP